ncbi:hypothetical protein SteCoe_23469 [Stentor coeruleus]|uniref:Uncharacterized protein n=1 Tax=Stentor coeruleus TaxID=5963 RepID=A0A1R2BJU1_9CILI|nr:hypothetical protein SteCoe_23469 [Stentor coeruleus]
MNKLKKHRKLYSYEVESTKNIGASDASLGIMIEKERERVKDDKKNNTEESKVKKSTQQIFTFQTLREALAINPDLYKSLNYGNRSTGRAFDGHIHNKQGNKYSFSSDSEYNKVTNYVNSLKEASNKLNSGTPTFLKIISQKNFINKPRDKKTRKTKSPAFEILKNPLVFEKLRKSRQDAYFNKELSIDYRYNHIPDKGKKDNRGSKTKMINVVFPKAIRNLVFSDSNSNSGSRLLEEDVNLKGWEKATPLGMLEN